MTKTDDLINELEYRIRQLKIEYDIFLVGGKNTPPLNLRNKLESLIQQILDSRNISYSQKFKFNTLVARYTAHKELWRKKLQEKEEKGILRSEEELGELLGAPAEAPVQEDANQYTFITTDPSRHYDSVKEFYQFMQQTSQRLGQKDFNMNFDKFFDFIQVKTAQLKEKYSCRAVEFQARVNEEEGKLKFSARVRHK
ncbi:MAG: hypothetical protein JXQ27_06895 [Acidobacteria bacterium]|nr:hypothetical protein [Acidobacteriota bacterium]